MPWGLPLDVTVVLLSDREAKGARGGEKLRDTRCPDAGVAAFASPKHGTRRRLDNSRKPKYPLSQRVFVHPPDVIIACFARSSDDGSDFDFEPSSQLTRDFLQGMSCSRFVRHPCACR